MINGPLYPGVNRGPVRISKHRINTISLTIGGLMRLMDMVFDNRQCWIKLTIIKGKPESRMNGEEFLRKMQAGDATVWDDLMPMLRRIALGACRDLGVFDELKEDIVQDVAVRVFTNWQSFSAKSSLTTWAYSIARNRCLDELRKRKVRSEDRSLGSDNLNNDNEFPPPENSHDPKLELMLCVQQVLAELDAQGPARKNSRRIIEVLTYWVEHSPTTEELAQFLQTSLQAAKQRKHEIRKRIEELCRRFCGNDDCSMQLTGSAA